MNYSFLHIKRSIIFLSLISFFSFSFSTSYLHGQTKVSKSKKEEKKSNFWADKMWYGGGFQINFGSYNSQGYQVSEFVFGLSPMAGYKVTKHLSVGPRLEYTLYVNRYNDGFNVQKVNASQYGGGVFTRMKFLKILFAHVEYDWLNNPTIYQGPNGLFTEHNWDPALLAGLGYNPSSDYGSYEFYILYDFLAPDDSPQVPIQYRVGFTYKF